MCSIQHDAGTSTVAVDPSVGTTLPTSRWWPCRGSLPPARRLFPMDRVSRDVRARPGDPEQTLLQKSVFSDEL
jgi:hypothetical protein